MVVTRPGVRRLIGVAVRFGLPTRLCFVLASLGLATQGGAQSNPPSIVDQVQVDTRRPIDFHAAAFPESVYVGQQSTYQVGVFVANSLQNRLRRNPEYVPPELRGLLSYDLGSPRQITPPNAPQYQAHVFQRAFFPVAAGKVDIPSPQLSYSLPRTASYFSGEDRFVVRAETAHLVVKPLPREGQPREFTGAVGVYSIESQVDTVNARVGDPLLLKMRVDGIGNVKMIPRPAVEIEWASVVPGTERLRVDSSGALVRGAKEFEWILTPSRDGRVTLPSFKYHYFDPYRSQYREARTEPAEIEVHPGVLSTADAREGKSLLALREPSGASEVSQMGARRQGFSRSEAVIAWVVLLSAPLPALLMFIRAKSTRKEGLERRGSAPKVISFAAGDELTRNEVARRTRRTLHTALASRLRVDAQLLSSRRQLLRLLRRRGVTRAGAARVAHLLEDLDLAGFARTSGDIATLNDSNRADLDSFTARAQECFRIVDDEAIPVELITSRSIIRFSHAWKSLVMIGVVSIYAPVVSANAFSPQQSSVTIDMEGGQSEPLSEMTQAVDAYQRRMFREATQNFGDLARANPGNVDVLFNWGTAAWEAQDTVTAVVAWQRAARLDPLAADIQERVVMLPAGARGGIADVPMVPVRAFAVAAVVLWVFAWMGFAFLATRISSSMRHASVWRVVSFFCLVLALGLGGTAWWGTRALDPQPLSVLLKPETMHVAPGAESDAMGGVATGDVVRRLRVDGLWTRVEHSDGRLGWLPTSRLTNLVADVVDDTGRLISPAPSWEYPRTEGR